jgi:hypothetical protein
MSQTLTHPFPLRLTRGERSTLDQVFEAFNARPGSGLSGRITRAEVARMALDRGLRLLLQEVPATSPVRQPHAANRLPHDEAWMKGGLEVATELLPPFNWGSLDPTQHGDPILVVAGRGAFVVS